MEERDKGLWLRTRSVDSERSLAAADHGDPFKGGMAAIPAVHRTEPWGLPLFNLNAACIHRTMEKEALDVKVGLAAEGMTMIVVTHAMGCGSEAENHE